MKRYWLLFLLLIPQVLWAADLPTGSFTPPPTDLSVSYLADIFGIVDGVLHGTGSQILGAMFGVFNSAVLALGSIVIAYMLMVSTINTAHEGEVLGKKWSSIWIPIRSTAGIALMLPKASGYSVIQIFVMWVVVQGVGAADSVTNAAMNYLIRGGVIVQASVPPDQGAVLMAGNILRSEICMLGAFNSLQNHPPAGVAAGQIPSFSNSLAVTQLGTTQLQMQFPGSTQLIGTAPNQALPNYQGLCGSVSWTPSNDGGGSAEGSTTQIANPSGLTYSDSRSIAVQQVVQDVLPVAQIAANALIPLNNTSGGSLASALPQYSLVYAAADYKGIMLPYLAQQSNAFRTDAINQITNNVTTQGWIVLGTYYLDLTQLNNNYNAAEGSMPSASINQPSGTISWSNSGIYSSDRDLLDGKAAQGGTLDSLSGNDISKTSCSTNTAITPNTIDNFICEEQYNYLGPQNAFANTTPVGTTGVGANVGMQIGGAIFGALTGGIGGIIMSLASLGSAQALNTDPIIAVSALGSSVLNFVTTIWVLGISIFGLVTVMSVVPCVNSIGFGSLAMFTWMVPFIAALMIGLFAVGSLMAFYVPMIPFILFVFGGIGWMIAVIESMIAAPLVALGLTSPEGHEYFGKAEHAIMLLVNIFMRPTLMVFGFIAGTILSHVGLWLLNQGFGHAWGMAYANDLPYLVGYFNYGLGAVWGLIAALTIYVGFVLAIVNKSFALIYEIPNKVLRWIGGGIEQLGEGQGAEDVKGSFQGGMKGMGDATGGASQGQAQKGMGDISQGMEAKRNKPSGLNIDDNKTPPANPGK